MSKGQTMEAVISIAGQISPSLQKSIDKASKKFGGLKKGVAIAGAAAATGITAITGATIAATVKLGKLGEEFKEASNTIRIGTGATGDALVSLNDDMKAVYSSIPTDLGNASTAISDYNTRLGLVGKPLQELSRQAISTSDLLGEDLSSTIEQSSKAFQQWNIKADDMSKEMDYIFKTSQSTGAGFNSLMSSLQSNGAVLQSLNFGFDESAAMLGNLEKAGINVNQVMKGLKKGLGNIAKEGGSVSENLSKYISKIQNAGSYTKALTIATDIFGNATASTMVQAIQSGAMNVDELTKSLQESDETINQAAKDTYTLADKWNIISNKSKAYLEPIASGILDKVDELMPAIESGFDKILPVVATLGDSLISVLEESGKVFIPTIVDAINDVIPIVEQILPTISQSFGQILPIILSLIGSTLPVFTELATSILPIISDSINAILPIINSVLPMISDTIVMMFPFLEELASSVLPIVSSIIETISPILSGVFGVMQEVLGNVLDSTMSLLTDLSSSILPVLYELLQMISPILMVLVDSIGKIFSESLSLLMPLITNLINSLMPAVLSVLQILLPILAVVFQELQPIIDSMTQILVAILPLFISLLNETIPIIEFVANALAQSLGTAFQLLIPVIESVMTFLKNVFTGNWRAVWTDVVNILKNVFTGIVSIVKVPINGVISVINNMISSINSIGFDLPDWIPGIGGKSFSIDIPLIPTFAHGGFTNGISIAGEEGQEAVISFDKSVRKENLSYWAQAGRMLGVNESILDLFDISIPKEKNQSMTINYSPTIIIQGNANKSDVDKALKESQEEFFDRCDDWWNNKNGGGDFDVVY